jgi:archaellum component FlaC|tara:strand:- start:589 stop:801 length:213 start_codon:yes stop_codon:yes gene_type:complete
MHTIALSNRIINGINTPVVTVDGFDIDTIEDRRDRLKAEISRLQDKLDTFSQMADMIDDEWNRLKDNKGF